MYILYKEIGQFPVTITPIYSFGGRSIAKVEDDTFNYLTGNIKVLDRAIVDIGANHYGKNEKKYYIRADGSGFSSSRVDDEDIKVEDPLEAEEKEASEALYKLVLISNVEDVFHDRFKALNNNKPELESSTWNAQSVEAKAFINDNTIETPVLSALANARGISLNDQVNKVIAKENAYNIEVAALLGQQQVLTDQIKACDDIKELCKWNEDNFGIQMNRSWADELGLLNDDYTRTTEIINGVKF